MLKDTDKFPFGKYKGVQLIDVPAGYLLWLYDNGLRKGDVRDYIFENLEVLKKELADEQSRTNKGGDTRR